MKLCDEYIKFLSEQTHVSPSTLKLMRTRLKGFPEPDGLNTEWFRKRMKKVSPRTVRQELIQARRVLKWLGRDTTDLERVKLPRVKDTVTVEDLYTREELEAIFKACTHTRDRAMFQVLYESAVRASELLSMTFENIIFNDDGTAAVTVKGKTGTRQVPILESVPALRAWMDVHPNGKGKIWTSIMRPYGPLSYGQLHNVTGLTIDRASLKRAKKKIVHMFRHTRATELVRFGVRGQSLSKFMGWTKKSNMEAVYVHLSTEDVNNEIRSKVFGMDQEETTQRPLLSSTTCPRCQTKNDQNARVCSKCNMPLSNDAIVVAMQQKERKEEEIERLVQERVDESMERVMEVFAAAIQDIKSTKTVRDLATAFARKMKEESTLTNKE